MAHLALLLQRPATRLLTLTGAGGVGKTRLALALATAAGPLYVDGVWLVELATLADPVLVPRAVLAALGLRDESDHQALAILAARLQGRPTLLVLDNCEHLIGACAALLAELLRACADLRVVATSRERLALAGERLYRVPSLASPDPRHPLPAERLGDYPWHWQRRLRHACVDRSRCTGWRGWTPSTTTCGRPLAGHATGTRPSMPCG